MGGKTSVPTRSSLPSSFECRAARVFKEVTMYKIKITATIFQDGRKVKVTDICESGAENIVRGVNDVLAPYPDSAKVHKVVLRPVWINDP